MLTNRLYNALGYGNRSDNGASPSANQETSAAASTHASQTGNYQEAYAGLPPAPPRGSAFSSSIAHESLMDQVHQLQQQLDLRIALDSLIRPSPQKTSTLPAPLASSYAQGATFAYAPRSRPAPPPAIPIAEWRLKELGMSQASMCEAFHMLSSPDSKDFALFNEMELSPKNLLDIESHLAMLATCTRSRIPDTIWQAAIEAKGDPLALVRELATVVKPPRYTPSAREEELLRILDGYAK